MLVKGMLNVYCKYRCFTTELHQESAKNKWLPKTKCVQVCNKGYTPNDIFLTFMKYIFENNDNDLILDTESKLKIYEIISLNYIRVNSGIDTLLQLCGCISKIFLYLRKK